MDLNQQGVSQHKAITPQKDCQPLYPEDTIHRVRLHHTQNDFPTIYKANLRETHYKGIVTLYDRCGQPQRFRVFKDVDMEIKPRHQNLFHDSRNDDDRDTTGTQLARAITQTIQDVREGIAENLGKMRQPTQNYSDSSTEGSYYCCSQQPGNSSMY